MPAKLVRHATEMNARFNATEFEAIMKRVSQRFGSGGEFRRRMSFVASAQNGGKCEMVDMGLESYLIISRRCRSFIYPGPIPVSDSFFHGWFSHLSLPDEAPPF